MHLSSVFGALIEEATLARRMLKHLAYVEDAAFANGPTSRAEIIEKEAAQVSQWLHALTGLVDPEPTSSLSGRGLEQDSWSRRGCAGQSYGVNARPK